jgi:membrane protein DedA with SNARE-associated domain
LDEIINSISTYGYIIIALYSFGGGFIALIGGAILSSMGKLDIGYVILVAGISNMIGDLFLFYIGKYQKKELSKYPFFIKHRRKMAYSKILIKKYAILSVFIQKYLYGIKTLIPIIFGITNYNFMKFAILNAFASIIWAVWVGLITFYSSDVILKFFEENEISPIFLPIILFSTLFIFWKFLDFKTRK